ncbi:hypothetical protein OS493_004516 [Desmophyllum pertusum]|uniref:Uncharacterized protein n=1 Tax=Desmophyllum pertusum TaxID=174260 RepID=A0A9W9ZH75_9CNID|nr:hypothetical protein OS493_004516 [Desmophyllum pertusum]
MTQSELIQVAVILRCLRPYAIYNPSTHALLQPTSNSEAITICHEMLWRCWIRPQKHSFAVVKDCIPYPIHAVDRLVVKPQQHINVALTAVYDVKAVVSIVT